MSQYLYSQHDDEPDNVAEVEDDNYWTDMAEFIAGRQGNDN